MSLELRIDNRRQSAILATLHFSLAMCCRESYYISNESLYFCLSNYINEITITYFQEIMDFKPIFQLLFYLT